MVSFRLFENSSGSRKANRVGITNGSLFMKELKKMLHVPVASGFAHLSSESLAMILGGKSTVEGTGGCSCGQTGSSCGCDGTARCNCTPPIKRIPPQTSIHY